MLPSLKDAGEIPSSYVTLSGAKGLTLNEETLTCTCMQVQVSPCRAHTAPASLREDDRLYNKGSHPTRDAHLHSLALTARASVHAGASVALSGSHRPGVLAGG
jgi:phospholipase/lecithinase/hemolysin